MGLAVVGREDDDRAVGQAVGFELLQNQADLAVELRRRVEILGPILARHRMIGIVRRNHDLRRVGVRRRVKRPVRLLKIDLREERLMPLQIAPAVASRTAGRRT